MMHRPTIARHIAPIVPYITHCRATEFANHTVSGQEQDYAANKGVDWAVLTNGVTWRVYKVMFAKPIDFELILDLDLMALNPRSAGDIETLYLLSREGISKSALPDFHAHRQATSRFLLGAILTSDAVLDVVRRELRRMSPDVRVDSGELRASLEAEVLKREVVEGEKAEEARKRVAKAASRMLRAKTVAKPEPTVVDQRVDDSAT